MEKLEPLLTCLERFESQRVPRSEMPGLMYANLLHARAFRAKRCNEIMHSNQTDTLRKYCLSIHVDRQTHME